MTRVVYLAAVCAMLGSSAWASDRTLMEVDFDRPIWTELVTHQWGGGGFAEEDGSLRLETGVCVGTPLVPYVAGQTVAVSVRGRCQGVEASDAEWKVGRVVVTGYDLDRNECWHQDVMVVGGDTEWRTVEKAAFQPPEAARYFNVRLSNEGRSGTVWFDDLKIDVRDPRVEELIGDPGFEGALGVDHWYFRTQGKDWDDLAAWEAPSTAAIASEFSVEGRQCLRMDGTSTVVSKAFPYNGERLVLSGWMRRKDVTGAGWQTAGVQLVGWNADGKQVAHFDLDGLTNNQGSGPWTYYYAEWQFNAAVKTVQVWLRVFDNATGTVWYDNYNLGRIPLKGAIKPYDAEKAEVTVDASEPGPVIRHRVWAGTDLSFACWLLRGDSSQWLDLATAAGLEVLRMHEFHNAMKIYTHDDESGNPVYDWSRFDPIFDMLIRRYKLTPVITLETTPDALDKPGSRKANWINTDPPRDMEKWGRYIEAIFEHALDRYGKDEVETWLWEIWNEPGFPSGYFTGTPDDLATIAEQDYRAAARVEKRRKVDLKMGLTSGGGEGPDAVILNRLREIGMVKDVDHYSLHLYSGWHTSLRLLPEWLKRDYRKQFPELREDVIFGNTEWNASSMNEEVHDRPWNASLAIKYVQCMLDGNLDYGLFFNLVDHPELPAPGPPLFAGHHGMLTRTGVPKAVYNAFVFLNELKGGRRLTLESSNDPIDGIAVMMPDGAIRMVVTSFDEDVSRQPYTTRVQIAIKGVQGSYGCSRLWACDEEYGNPFRLWVETGRPHSVDQAGHEALMTASRYGQLPVPAVSAQDNVLTVELDVPGPGIRLLELTPSAATQPTGR